VAALEFKSQVGPSFGNNFNNRTEEAIGSATDVWRAYEEGTYGTVRPWLGYVFLLEETDKSTAPVRISQTVFPVCWASSSMRTSGVGCVAQDDDGR
jgi:hypothetical protein